MYVLTREFRHRKCRMTVKVIIENGEATVSHVALFDYVPSFNLHFERTLSKCSTLPKNPKLENIPMMVQALETQFIATVEEAWARSDAVVECVDALKELGFTSPKVGSHGQA